MWSGAMAVEQDGAPLPTPHPWTLAAKFPTPHHRLPMLHDIPGPSRVIIASTHVCIWQLRGYEAAMKSIGEPIR